MKVETLLKSSSLRLKNFMIDSSILDSELLLAKALKISREKLLINLEKKLSKIELNEFNKLIEQRINKKPIAYIRGFKEFWKSNFAVNQNVLVPRPETELIVEEAINILKNQKSYKILDIGTGSGCILLSILKDNPLCIGHGIDVSFKAIKIANLNANLQHLNNRVRFIKSDIDNYYTNNYDLIVSNPPYINKYKLSNLKEDIKKFEPNVALDGGPCGYKIIKKVILKSSSLIKKKGILILEIDNNQVENTKKILKKYGFFLKKTKKDLNDCFRCLISEKI